MRASAREPDVTHILLAGLKTFGFSFGLMALVLWYTGGNLLGFPLVLGTILGLLNMFWQWRADRALHALGALPKNSSVQVKTIELSILPEDAFSVAKSIIEDMPTVVQVEVDGLSLQARRSAYKTGWGERITIACSPGPSGTTLRLTSRSLWRLHINDFGQNQLIVERLSKEVSEFAKQDAQTKPMHS